MLSESEKNLLSIFINNTSIDTISIGVLPLYIYEDFLNSLGWEKEDCEDNTNGWEIDFWYSYTKKESSFKLELSGSLYYGGYKINKIYEQKE